MKPPKQSRIPQAVAMILLASALAASNAGAQAKPVSADQSKPGATAEADVRKLLNEFLAGAQQPDVKLYDRFFADDVVYTGSSSGMQTKYSIMKSLVPPKEHDPIVMFRAEDVIVHMYPENNIAIVAFRLVMDSDDHGTVSTSFYRNTGTFLFHNGRWQVIAWQATPVPPMAKQKDSK